MPGQVLVETNVRWGFFCFDCLIAEGFRSFSAAIVLVIVCGCNKRSK